MTRHNTKLLKKQFEEGVLVSKMFPSLVDPSSEATRKKEAKRKTELKTLQEFERRGFKYGTREESWAALEQMAQDMAEGKQVTPEAALWFVSAMNAVQEGDIKGLVRQLGFHEMGRSRVVNPHDIGGRMAILVEKHGLLKSEASRQCAAEFKCSPSTALAWYAKRTRQNVVK